MRDLYININPASQVCRTIAISRPWMGQGGTVVYLALRGGGWDYIESRLQVKLKRKLTVSEETI